MRKFSSSHLLAQLSNAAGTPGDERAVREVIRQQLAEFADFSYDKVGSIICRSKGDSEHPTIMLAAHMDEVGFIVRYVTNQGFVKFHPLGGWWGHVLLAQPVVIKTAGGDVPGVIGAKPVHHLQSDERQRVLDIQDMFIDVGAASKQEAQETFGIRPGDHIVPNTPFTPLHNPRLVSGKAFDDRVGVALLIEVLRNTAGPPIPSTVYGVGTAQEEVGTRGAATVVEAVKPDVAIVLEGSPADDTPGFPKEERQGQLGRGPQIRVFDPAMIANRALLDMVLDTARQTGIRHQIAVRTSGGTDARAIQSHHTGVPTVVIAVPVRYSHSHIGLLHLDDYEASLALLLELLKRFDAATVAGFTDFS
jgi:putative aminopeptidase FrvX